MTGEPVYYRPPAEHEQHIRGLIRFLILFFAGLIAIVTLVVLNAQTLATKLPFSAEKRFVEGIERSIMALARESPSDDRRRIEDYLQALVDDLAEHMDVPDDFEITVHFLNSDELNAFATLGGHLFVLRGLISALPDENSLAMVLAHEIAHIKHRDPLAGLGRGVALQIIYAFLTGQHSRSSDVASLGGSIGLMFFSREQEQAADLEAIAGLQSTYGHVAGSETLFRTLADSEETGGSEIPAWLSTHPQLEERIRVLSEYAGEHGWTSGTPRPYPSRIVAALDAIGADATTAP